MKWLFTSKDLPQGGGGGGRSGGTVPKHLVKANRQADRLSVVARGN